MTESKLPRGKPLKGCGICGGELAIIRPKHPRGEPRVVCPTCLQERIDHVLKILNPKTPRTNT